jgi:hypothetical protein
MINIFLSGAITMGFLLSALFFLAFWRRTGDKLFLPFAVAFVALGTAQAVLALGNVPSESRSWIFLLRFAAFLLIAIAIVLKNKRG